MQVLTPDQQAAAKLLEFGRRICDLPLHALPERREFYGQTMALVKDFDKPLFENAIAELRLAFLAIDQWRDPRGTTDVSGVQLNTETFLEWLTRLDLQAVSTQDGASQEKLQENRERWLLLDYAFGRPESFWSCFQALRGNL